MGSGPSPTPVEFSSHCHFCKLSCSWLLGMALHSCLLWLDCLFTVHMGSGPSHLACGVFLPPPLLQAFLLLVAGRCSCSCLLWLACLFTVPWGIAFLPPLCYVSFLSLFIIQCLFFPWVGLVCAEGYADLAQGCLWENCVLLSSLCGLPLPKQSGHWHLVARETRRFLCLTWSGNAMHGLGVWRSQNFACSRWFFL
jgi:hypothetical protein